MCQLVWKEREDVTKMFPEGGAGRRGEVRSADRRRDRA